MIANAPSATDPAIMAERSAASDTGIDTSPDPPIGRPHPQRELSKFGAYYRLIDNISMAATPTWALGVGRPILLLLASRHSRTCTVLLGSIRTSFVISWRWSTGWSICKQAFQIQGHDLSESSHAPGTREHRSDYAEQRVRSAEHSQQIMPCHNRRHYIILHVLRFMRC